MRSSRTRSSFVPHRSAVRFISDSPFSPEALATGRIEVLTVPPDTPGGGERIAAHWAALTIGTHSRLDKPEDIEIVGSTLYIAVSREHRVLSVDFRDADAPTVGEFVRAGPELPDFAWPDNLASDPSGALFVTEDIDRSMDQASNNDVWVAKWCLRGRLWAEPVSQCRWFKQLDR